jgi:signal transduction histidine kinase
MMRIRGRFALLVTTAAVLPLIVFGIVAVDSLRTGTRQSVMSGHVLVATRAAEEIEQYVDHAVRTLQALAADLQGTSLRPWQQERILRNYVLAFPVFREVVLFDDGGQVVATSRLVPTTLRVPAASAFDRRGVALSPITIDDDLLPRTTVSVQVRPGSAASGTLLAEMRLEELWRRVDRLRVGSAGFALLVDRDGRLIAHGNPDEKDAVARGGDLRAHPMARAENGRWPVAPVSLEYAGADGRPMLGAAAPLPTLAWTLVVEQPTSDAYALLHRLERQLFGAIALALLITVVVGYYWGLSFIRPITTLLDGTRALAAGRLDTRVRIDRRDEFATLGDGFNSMADRLAALQQEARRQERQAMFGRIAAGLVHDLSHPIQNIGNNCRLILKMHDDPEYRETFRRTVERELQIVKRLFEDLRNLARPIPLERFPVDLGRSMAEAVDGLRSFADAAGLAIEYDPPAEPITIEGDVFALGRVYRNLVLNAIQATAPGGRVRIVVDAAGGRARVRISDTGCGIPEDRLEAIFEDFATTKRRGLGLGLPISKKVVEQLGGTIAVESAVGIGTTVTIELPLAEGTPLHALADRGMTA